MDLTNLTDEVYFAELKMMFNTNGWDIFLQELRDNADIIGDIQDCSTSDDLYYRKGQLSSIGRILNLQDTIKRAEEETDESPE
jgi:hypothetical protein